ncbi:glycosyltransferase [Pseudanabaena biceps]|nr:glycosyltransferase [Pseudanabaena biceps]
MPKVTVLMPVYNGDKYINEAIDSILNQTFTDFELLIIDDGSTDKSLEIIKSYPDPRIRLIRNLVNLGISKSLNIGLAESLGDYVARMDSDDISLPNRLQKQIEFLNQNPDVIVLGSYIEFIDTHGNKLENLDYLSKYPLSHKAIIYAMLYCNPLAHPSVAFKRLEVLKLGGYRVLKEWESVSTEDYDLWLRLASQNYKFANLSDRLIKYRIHSDSLTQVAITKGKLSIGSNNCLKINALDVFGCSPEEINLLRNKDHPYRVHLFVKIAKHLSKNKSESYKQILQSEEYMYAIKKLTSRTNVVSRLLTTLLTEKPIRLFISEIFVIFKDFIELISRIANKILKQ